MPPTAFLDRLGGARRELQRVALDALVVTHPPNVRYLTGFAGTAGLLALTPDRCVMVVDFRYASAAREVLLEQNLAAEVSLTVAPQGYDEVLVQILQDCRAGRIAIEADRMSVSRFNRLSAALAGAAPTPLETSNPCPVLVPTERFIERARLVKDTGEVATLRRAAGMLGRLAASVSELAQPGRSEIEVAADIDTLLRRAGFERPAFATIVASGPNSARPHARPSRRILQDGDGVVLDFGGVYDGYCVDLSRTVQIGQGRPELRRIFDAVAAAQAAAIASIRPGVLASAIDAVARETLEGAGLGDAFGHSTGHGLGLELHEEPRIGRKQAGCSDMPLMPGMVFTVEPGAYVEGLGGVRIEDDVLVTETGCEVLTRV